MSERFVNNFRATLENALADDATDVYLPTGSTAGMGPGYFGEGEFQRVTLEHPGQPLLPPEIAIVTFYEPAYPMLRLRRGQEGTTAQNWPVGTQMTCRVTAGMLASFVGSSLSPTSTTHRQLLHVENPVLRGASPLMAEPWPWNGDIQVPKMGEQPVALESVFQSGICDFGTPETYDPGTTYYQGAVVRPPTPDGNQYALYLRSPDDTATGAVTFGTSTMLYDEQSQPKGVWAQTAEPLDIGGSFSAQAGEGLLMSECGVVIFYADPAATPPVVSLGTYANPTAFADSVAVTLTTVGADRVGLLRVRIPDTFQDLVRDLNLTVVTPGSAPCLGYLYCRGVQVRLW